MYWRLMSDTAPQVNGNYLQRNKFDNTIAIIPAYNESKRISELIEATKRFVTAVVVIDDGSVDDTFEQAVQSNAIVYKNRRNRGKGAALRRGFKECMKLDPDIIITLDADGQHDPCEIPKLIQPIKEGFADMVIGSRYDTNSIHEVPLLRGIGLSVINALNKSLVNVNVRDTQSGFRAYSKSVFGTVSDYDSDGYGAETEQLAQVEVYGFDIVEVPVNIKYKGLERTSKKNPFSHGLHLVATILKLAIEKKPLVFFGLSGLALIVSSLLPLAYILDIFNETRYFSIPFALLTLGLVFIGSLLIVLSFVLYALKRIRSKLNKLY
jgi:glycosyltransferase involved in cell wall biosynthesis